MELCKKQKLKTKSMTTLGTVAIRFFQNVFFFLFCFSCRYFFLDSHPNAQPLFLNNRLFFSLKMPKCTQAACTPVRVYSSSQRYEQQSGWRTIGACFRKTEHPLRVKPQNSMSFFHVPNAGVFDVTIPVLIAF